VNLVEMWPTAVEMDASGSDRDATINSEDVEFLNTCKILNYKSGSASWIYVKKTGRWVLFMTFLPL
jgi:hypothetical protein